MPGVLFLMNQIFILGLIGISIYGFVLFVKLANRGIKALDIYINEKTKKWIRDYNKNLKVYHL